MVACHVRQSLPLSGIAYSRPMSCCRASVLMAILGTMPRPNQMPPRAPLTKEEIEKASYVGSPEHKVKRFWGGLPQAWIGPDGRAKRPKKQKTNICHRTTDEERDEASGWVQEALSAGQLRFCDGDGIFPKHIWYRDEEGQFWFGFAVNQTAGTYKGWPITEAEKLEAFD